mmetsp:Transcript_19147/g.34728  ORF Transcript_19147/g.34728 Transcript_19147/m.34728 type:complete len:229 (-) Transcript_19147:833-1519(-)
MFLMQLQRLILFLRHFLSFLRPPVPIGPVQDLFFSTCKQVLNEYNIVGKMSVDIETRPSRVQPTNNSNVVSNTDDLVLSSFIVSPLNARRASIEDIMRVSPGTSLQLLVPTHYKTKKKGTPMAVIAKNYCLQQGITDYTKYGCIVFSGIQYAVLPAIVRSNPKQQELLTGLRQSDIQRLYDQKEGISLDMPSTPQPISLWWRHLNANTERFPIIVWGNFDFGHRPSLS